MKRKSLYGPLFAALLTALLVVGCSKKDDKGKDDNKKKGNDNGMTGDGHPEKGPNGGQIIEFKGEHKYHGEVVFDEKSESLTIYILDKSAKKQEPIEAKEVVVNFKAHGSGHQAKLKAKPMEGETDSKCSRFVPGDDHDGGELVEHYGDKGMDAELRVTIGGETFVGKFPEGKGEGHVHKDGEKHDDEKDKKKGKKEAKKEKS